MSLIDGDTLHRTLPADMWCATKKDFQSLRKEISDAIEDGTIVPTERDPFDMHDRVIGPNFYTVCEQFIKPITRSKGNMSWALMKHPEGLKCDVFISHAWAEGAFEFIDKVLWSWPAGAENAWCCMLANPQNLDISDLIASPSESPFAVALRSAQHVLVVPNNTCSVYSRLWCVYEAYLAYSHDKLITTAKSPWWQSNSFVVGIALACIAVGTAVAVAVDHMGVNDETEVNLLLLYASAFLVFMPWSLLIRQPHLWRFGNLCGAIICGFVSARYSLELSSRLKFFATALFFVVAEYDRSNTLCVQTEARLLEAGWAGAACASCSQIRDSANIHKDIGGSFEEVDVTVEVLLHAGMSTERLRKAHASGVNVYQAAHAERALMLWSFAVIPSDVISVFDPENKYEIKLLAFAVWTLQFVWLLLFKWLPSDTQAFSLRTQQKLFTCFLIFFLFPLMCGTQTSDTNNLRAVWCALLLMWLLIIITTVKGIHGVAGMPCCGRLIAEFLAARVGFGCCMGHCTHEEAQLSEVKIAKQLYDTESVHNSQLS